MSRFLKRFAASFVSIALSGCTALQVLTFEADERSFQISTQEVTLQAILARKGSGAESGQVPGLPKDDEKYCADLPQTDLKVFTVGVPVIIGAATILLNLAFSEIGSYVDRRMKEFKQTYASRINTSELSFVPGTNWTRCLRLQRKVGKGKELAMDLIIGFEPVGDDALTLRPRFLDLRKAAAKTSKQEGAVDFDITIAIVTIQVINGRRSARVLATQELSFRGVKITGENQPALGPKYFGDKYDTAVFPRPSRGESATIALGVTETGSGAEDFGQFKKGLEAHQAAVRSALLGALTEFLK